MLVPDDRDAQARGRTIYMEAGAGHDTRIGNGEPALGGLRLHWPNYASQLHRADERPEVSREKDALSLLVLHNTRGADKLLEISKRPSTRRLDSNS